MEEKVFKKTKDLMTKFDRTFYIFGLWPKDTSTICYTFYSYIMFTIFFIIFVIVSTLEAVCNDNLEEAMFASLMSIAVACIGVRIITFYIYKPEIDKLLLDTDIFADISKYCQNNREQHHAVLKKVNSFISFGYKMYYMFIVTVLMMMIVPIFNEEKVLLVKIWLPFNLDWKRNDSVFWFMYAYTMASMALYTISIGRCLFVWFIMLNISLKFEILGYRLNNLTTQPNHIFNVKSVIIDCIQYHLQIKEEIKRFGRCFNNLFTFQIMTSAVSLCAEAFVLAFVEPETPFEYLLYVATLLYLTFEIFFVLYYGNEIITNSAKLATFLFHSQWSEQSLAVQKNVKILMETYKRPVPLFVGFVLVFPLNLSTFTSILNMSYSLFNILRNS